MEMTTRNKMMKSQKMMKVIIIKVMKIMMMKAMKIMMMKAMKIMKNSAS